MRVLSFLFLIFFYLKFIDAKVINKWLLTEHQFQILSTKWDWLDVNIEQMYIGWQYLMEFILS